MNRIVLMLTAAFWLIVSAAASAHDTTGAKHAHPHAKNGNRLMLLSANPRTPAKIKLILKLAAEQGLDAQHVRLRGLEPETRLAELVRGFDLVLLEDINQQLTQRNFAAIAPQIDTLGPEVKIMALRWPDGATLRHGVDEAAAHRIAQYFSHGGRENFSRMLRHIRAELLDDPEAGVAEPPIVYPAQGIYAPGRGRAFDAPESYLAWYRAEHNPAPDAPVVGIAVHGEHIASENTAMIDGLIQQVAAAGAIPMAIYYTTDKSIAALGDWLKIGGRPAMDVWINTRLIHWAESQRQIYEALGVTVLHAIAHRRDEQHWREDQDGLSARSIPFLTLSEIAGTIDPTVLAARAAEDGRHYPIDEQMDRLVRKAVRIAKLARIANRDKKVAILYYSYPPGEKGAGASFLNVPRSVEQISKRMQQAGYHTETIEAQTMINAIANLRQHARKDRETSPATLVKQGIGATLPLSAYRRWYNNLPETVRQKIEADWGKPEAHPMVARIDGQAQFVIPMIRSGNLMVLPQPSRGEDKDWEKSLYHDKNLAINHYYLAVYLYLRQTFGADALVHLGTHGSHEWLPGKARSLWVHDPGSLAADDTPIIYPYIVDDVGEALQAKRRGHAVMISHMTPPFAPSGLYREMAELHELMHQYETVDPGLVRQQTRRQLLQKLEEMNIPADMGWQPTDVEARFEDFLVELHDYMHDLASEHQPLGLHTWGKLPEERLLVATVMQILGTPYTDAIAAWLHERDHEQHHHDHDHNHAHGDAMGDSVKLENIPGFELIERVVIRGEAIPEDAGETLKALLLKGRELTARIREIMEMSSFLDALDGRFIPPSTGGDPIRNDESLPTERNLYGFDPSRLPTKAAFASGRQLVNQLITDYTKKHGKYPQKLAFSLWSTETMRHHGVLESQALYAMGLRPVWAENGRVIGTEIIPYAELGRPRIDVVLSATSLYRDAFPGVMKRLADGIEQIARLKEENNYLQRNTARIRQELMDAGLAPEEADYLSTVRIFSRESGQYGTGLEEATRASDTWETDSRLARLYLDRMGYAFGSDQNRWSEKVEGVDLYAKNLSGTDVALFSRSSNLHGLLTVDHTFAYLGGLALSVRHLDGKSPEMFITNLRDPKQEKMETLGAFLSKEMRTRYLHPRWIEEMQQEGYAGTLAILNTVNNLWGWQVADPQNVRADQWQAFFDIYVNDQYDLRMREWFEQSNAEALARISGRMLEAIRKGYWQPGEQTMKKLLETHQEISAQYDLETLNQKLKAFIAEQAAGYGLAAPNITPIKLPPVEIPQPAATAPAAQPVEGQKLEKIDPQPSEAMQEHTRYLLLALMLLILLTGAAWQYWRTGRPASSAANNNEEIT